MNCVARIVLVLATAALNLVGHRGVEFSVSTALHLIASLGWLWLVRGVVRGSYRPGFAEAFGLAVLLRLLVLPLAPALSDDVYRYVYEGGLVLEGGNPYTTSPEEAPLGLRDANWERINKREIPAAYPPAVQYALGLGVLLGSGPVGMKVLFGTLDLMVFLALWRWLPLLGVERERAIVHGFCPLVVLEFAGEGHNDSLAVLFMVLALFASAGGRHRWAGASLAVATAGKFLPVVLLPFLVRRSWSVLLPFLAVLGLLYVRFLAPFDEMFEGARQYAWRWRGNDSLFRLIIAPLEGLEGRGALGGWEAQALAKIPLGVLGVGLLVYGWLRRWRPEMVGAAFFVFYVAFTPVLHPWYVGFLVPFLCVYPNGGWLVFTGTVFLAYHVLPGWLGEGVWQETWWVKVLEYLPFYAGFLALKQRGKKRLIADQGEPP